MDKHNSEPGAESPTTARPFEMDDDDGQESHAPSEHGIMNTSAMAPALANRSQPSTPPPEAPPKPPRRPTEAQQNEATLKEAFPTVDNAVIKAVLRASGGKVEPAFHALLEMTDPDAAQQEPDEVPPPQPRRPQGMRAMSQVEADELYARQLAEHYDNVGAYEARTSNQPRGGPHRRHEGSEEREHSFIDDDLPIIRENLRKGFAETQTKVNGWISNLKKKIEENFDESDESAQKKGQSSHRQGQASRRSGDYDRYDADPQVLGDDFAGMKLSADGTPINGPAPAGSPKPRTSAVYSRSNDGRRVGFKDEHEEINMYDASPDHSIREKPSASSVKASKWQPISTLDPNPITDNDPFSLGDSDDEKDAKDKPSDLKPEDSERLKKAAAEAMADTIVVTSKSEGAGDKKS